MKLIVFDEKNNYFVKGLNRKKFKHKFSGSFSGSAKSNRIAISTIPGSPQEIPEQQKCETIYSLSTNPSSDMIDKVIDEQENIMNSDDDDEQAQMPVDEGQTECNNH